MQRIALSMILAVAALGCSKQSDSAAAPATTAVAPVAAPVPLLEPTALAAQIKAGDCQAVDANGDGTREKMGTVPGAILLTDSETYSPSKELPADKSKALVFYCANEHCGASHQAAHRAQAAGYTNVAVMPSGIAGWVAAGESIDHPTKS